MKTYLQEGMIIKPNENHMEYYFNGKNERLRIVQTGRDRVFAEDVRTGEYLGEIGNYEEVEYYYDVVKWNRNSIQERTTYVQI